MSARRVVKRTRRSRPVAERLLDAFFHTFSGEEGRLLASTICGGVSTGAALAGRLGWTRDKVSRWTDNLRTGGVIEKRREGHWVRVTPQLAGVDAAQTWVGALRAEAPPSGLPSISHSACHKLAGFVADEGRRALLTAMRMAPHSTQAELRRACGLSQPVASRSLTRLVDAGLASSQEVDGRARYALKAEAVEGLWSWLKGVRSKLESGRTTAIAVVLPKPGAKPPGGQAASPAPASVISPSLPASGAATPSNTTSHAGVSSRTYSEPAAAIDPDVRDAVARQVGEQETGASELVAHTAPSLEPRPKGPDQGSIDPQLSADGTPCPSADVAQAA